MTVRSHRKIDQAGGRTIVIGDIHGCLVEFEELLGLVGARESDLIVAVGDLIDRGPASWEVARIFRDRANFHTVIGNHERRLAGTVRGTSQPAWTQRQTLSLLTKGEREDWATWLEELPAVFSTRHAIVTHARLDPALTLDLQDRKHCAATGAAIERSAEGLPLWYHEWAGRNPSERRPIVLGHLAYERIDLVPERLYAIDTYGASGGRLTALVLPGFEIVSVPCPDYTTQARVAWNADRRHKEVD